MSNWWPIWLTQGNAGTKKQMKPIDAMHNKVLKAWFVEYLDNTDPPKTFKASEVAQRLTLKELGEMGYEKWFEVMPAIMELAVEYRAFGDAVIFQNKKLLGDDVLACEMQGDIRIGRNGG